MLIVRIVTLQGQEFQIAVGQCEFVRSCPVCHTEFRTIDPDKIYCKTSHKIRASERRVKPLLA